MEENLSTIVHLLFYKFGNILKPVAFQCQPSGFLALIVQAASSGAENETRVKLWNWTTEVFLTNRWP